MDPSKQIQTWIIWRTSVHFLLQDLQELTQQTTVVKLQYHSLIHFLVEGARAMEFLAKRDLRRNDVRILGEYQDKKEMFVLWKHRGETHMYRETTERIEYGIQEKVASMLTLINDIISLNLPII